MKSSDRLKIIKHLTPIFKEAFHSEIVVTEDLCALDLEEWDSLKHILLVSEIEIKFQFEFNTDELAEAKKIGDFIDIILNKGHY